MPFEDQVAAYKITVERTGQGAQQVIADLKGVDSASRQATEALTELSTTSLGSRALGWWRRLFS